MLKAAANHFVFNRPGAHEVYRAQRDMLTELAEALLENAGADLHPMFAEAWQAATGDGERLRVVVDQVASLTDVSAMRWHDRLVGSRARGSCGGQDPCRGHRRGARSRPVG